MGIEFKKCCSPAILFLKLSQYTAINIPPKIHIWVCLGNLIPPTSPYSPQLQIAALSSSEDPVAFEICRMELPSTPAGIANGQDDLWKVLKGFPHPSA